MDERFHQLIARVVEDSTDEDAMQALSARLEANAEERDYYLDYCRLHAELQYLASAEGAERRALDAVAAQALHPPQTPSPHAVERPAKGARKGLWGFFALAASVAVLLGWTRIGGEQAAQFGLRKPTIVASLVSTQHAVWLGAAFEPGDQLRVNARLRLKSGLLKMSTPDGAELLVEGPCDLLFKSTDCVELREGKLSARTADWATQFSVETKSLNVVDLGQQFAVSVDAGGNAEAHALDGGLRIEPLAAVDVSRTSFLLGEGQAVRVDPVAMKTTRLPADKDQFVLRFGDFRPYRPLVIHNSGRGLRVGDEDPFWRIIGGAEGAGYQGPQYAVVCEPDERYLSNHPLVSQWMSVAKDLRPGCLPNASYTFQTEFDLSGYDLSTVRILADVLADNGVAEVRINGAPVDLDPWRDNEFLQEFHRFRRAEIASGFVPGKNVIEIDVWNGIYQTDPNNMKAAEPTPNPMAIRVEWQAFGVPLSVEPDRDDVI
ncbi:MAG: hypothetical protein KF688_14355 [Pirellulales bacterium]|nr:hypothetical protein [Pirellulales bacterium]